MIEFNVNTDLAVVKACGVCAFVFGAIYALVRKLLREFRPSLDLNDAFLAAEMFELFDLEKHSSSLEKCLGGWNLRDEHGDWILKCGYDTPALAISAAILKLAGETGSVKS